MGNQARVGDETTCISTSTRNFPNRLGKGANVYLASAELAAVCAIMGKIPNQAEYLDAMSGIDTTAADTYRYLNFDTLSEYMASAGKVEVSSDYKSNLEKEVERLKSLPELQTL